ncbi:hypothetical protein [Tissierella sp.]
MKKKKEPLKVIIVNPEAIPIARDRLTLALIKLREKQLKAKEMEKIAEA